MSKQPNKFSQDGFTLVELIIAMAIFSFMLVIITTAVLQLFHIYEAGIQIRSTQKTTRLISQTISSDIQTALDYSYTPRHVPGNNYSQDLLCLFTTANSTVTQTASGEVYYTTPGPGSSQQLHRRTFTGMPTTGPSPCITQPTGGNPTVFPNAGQILTDDTVSLEVFQVTNTATTDPAYIGLHLSIAPVGALGASLIDATYTAGTHPDPTCLEGSGGSQYCSITNLTIGGTTHKELTN